MQIKYREEISNAIIPTNICMKMREIFFINLRYSLSLRNYIIS